MDTVYERKRMDVGKVSVVVPVYNTGRYLRQCLQSLKNQTLHDIEIICVNDGSTDDSKQIIEEFVAGDQRFKAIHKTNTGYGHSVNLGIKAANNPYIGIVESDDFAEPDMFQVLYEAAEKSMADFVKANYYTYSTDSKKIAMREDSLGELPYEQVLSARDFHKIFGLHPSVWTSLYRKSFLINHDIWFQETPGASYQDIAFAFKVNVCAKRSYLIPNAVLNYRVDNVDSSVHNPQKMFCVCDELHEMELYIKEKVKERIIDREWQEELKEIVAWLKVRNYMWNYLRLALPYQYAFLLKVQDELKAVVEMGWKLDVWGDWEKENVRGIVHDLDAFFQATSNGYEELRFSLFPILNNTFSVRGFRELLAEYPEIYLYGAGRIGQRTWDYLKKIGIKQKVAGFIVTKQEGNPREIDDKKVCLISEINKTNRKKALIIVTMQRCYQYEVTRKLLAEEFVNILLVDNNIKMWVYQNTDK